MSSTERAPLIIPPVPTLTALVELADGGNEASAEAALNQLITYKVWNLYILTRNGKNAECMWGRNPMDALLRALPSMLGSEWSNGLQNMPGMMWDAEDTAALKTAECVGDATANVGEIYARSFVRTSWRQFQRERGLQK